MSFHVSKYKKGIYFFVAWPKLDVGNLAFLYHLIKIFKQFEAGTTKDRDNCVKRKFKRIKS